MSDGISIGEVINLLKDEFPDVSVSKVRFLESQGLVDPHRSPSGYRQFFEEDLKRLRFILQQQRDHFLPLKVIKSKLTMWEHGEENVMPAPSGPPPEKLFAPSKAPLGLDELARASGLSRRQVGELIDHGILRPDDEEGDQIFSQEELAVAPRSTTPFGLRLRGPASAVGAYIHGTRFGAPRAAHDAPPSQSEPRGTSPGR